MIEALLAGFLGLFFGSFLNVCIIRLPRNKSVVKPRSHCRNCGRTVEWYDNIPVLSWMLLGAKCRYCKTPISFRYPLMELLTGLLFFWNVYARGWNPLGFKMCVFSFLTLGLIATDFHYRLLLDEFTKGGTLVGLTLSLLTPPASSLMVLVLPREWPLWVHGFTESLLGAALPALLLWGVGAAYERIRGIEGLGFGDIKMLMMIGAFLGLPETLLSVFFGSMAGAVLGSLYIVAFRKGWRYRLPYGSFLGAAALVVALFSEHILNYR